MRLRERERERMEDPIARREGLRMILSTVMVNITLFPIFEVLS